MEKLIFPLLTKDQIEVKVKKVSESGAVLLLYKTARTDMDLLDATVGPGNWTNDYREIKGNLYCGIAIRDNGEWIWKWDCGIESRNDGEGNEKKGEASDAFKRAGFRWGIGRELYTSPFIFVSMPTERRGSGYQLVGFPKFWIEEIDYENRTISKLRVMCKNKNATTEVFSFGCARSGAQKSQNLPPAPDKPEGEPMASAAQINVLKELMNDEQRAATAKQYGERFERLPARVAGKLLQKLKGQ